MDIAGIQEYDLTVRKQFSFYPLLKGKDYRQYQNVDLESFFYNEQKCEKVSDVCLLNDQYIFVKTNMGCLAASSSTQNMIKPDKQGLESTRSRLVRCLNCNRSSRVSPNIEEEEATAVKSNGNGWHNPNNFEIEIFQTKTNVTRLMGETALKCDLQSPRVTSLVGQEPFATKTSKVNAKSVTGFNSGLLQRFFKLLPWRRYYEQKSPKTKHKIQATVHKTYFVRWTKPPDTLWHGYGVERNCGNEIGKATLRRSRSSVF